MGRIVMGFRPKLFFKILMGRFLIMNAQVFGSISGEFYRASKPSWENINGLWPNSLKNITMGRIVMGFRLKLFSNINGPIFNVLKANFFAIVLMAQCLMVFQLKLFFKTLIGFRPFFFLKILMGRIVRCSAQSFGKILKGRIIMGLQTKLLLKRLIGFIPSFCEICGRNYNELPA